jgi:hypothetical protein
MTLSWVIWNKNDRIRRAERDAPAMRQGEAGKPVHLLQAALIINGIDDSEHGVESRAFYGVPTRRAVQACEGQFELTIRDAGVAGTQVIGALDDGADQFFRDHAGHFGSDLAVTDAPHAVEKAEAARIGLTALRAHMSPSPLPVPAPSPFKVVNEALRVHFRLLAPGVSGPKFCRAAKLADIDRILRTYLNILFVLRGATFTFRDGIPVNGVKIAAESFTGSRRVLFGPFFRDFRAPFGAAIGKEARAAILIHESMHSVDDTHRSGNDDIHISEFEPTYDTQPADKSILNPSSYAGFAAHVFLGRDPNPRFGLGPPYPDGDVP